MLRNYKLEIKGTEKIPSDSNVVFVCNHSNSHDFFTLSETFRKIGRNVTPLGAWDGLNFLVRLVFSLGDVTFIRRDNRKSTEKGMLKLCSKVLKGKDCIIFAEATWNLHPIKPMQRIKVGPAFVGFVTGKPIVPVIFEYVEKASIYHREKELYSKCIVTFGEPITLDIGESVFDITNRLQKQMEDMRRSLWDELGIKRDSLDDIDKNVYLNHLDLKKNKALGFKYNTEWESQFLLEKDNEFNMERFNI